INPLKFTSLFKRQGKLLRGILSSLEHEFSNYSNKYALLTLLQNRVGNKSLEKAGEFYQRKWIYFLDSVMKRLLQSNAKHSLFPSGWVGQVTQGLFHGIHPLLGPFRESFRSNLINRTGIGFLQPFHLKTK